MREIVVKRIAIVGAGGHGKVALDVLMLTHSDEMEVAFFDDNGGIREVLGYPVVGTVANLIDDPRFLHVFVAIGDNQARYQVVGQLERVGKSFLTLIHPWTCISRYTTFGDGTIAVAGTVVNAGASIGSHVILNTHCSVGHDCRVDNFVQIAPGVNLGGGAVVEEGAFLGIGVKVAPKVTIGAWSVIGAGSIVLRDVPAGVLAYGVPARVVRATGEQI